jgi:hypothetical protein
MGDGTWCLASEVEALEAENAALKATQAQLLETTDILIKQRDSFAEQRAELAARGPVLSDDETRALLTAQSACSIAASSYDPRSDKRRQFIDAEAAIRNLLERVSA